MSTDYLDLQRQIEEAQAAEAAASDPNAGLGGGSNAPEAPPVPRPGAQQEMSPFLKAAMASRGGFGKAPVPNEPDTTQSPQLQEELKKNDAEGQYGSKGASAGDIMSMMGGGGGI